uniref:Uncharacterized protein n=1 Tax=Arundo donax TaxID=35708 RepID=A0A0A9GSD2_ARUDO
MSLSYASTTQQGHSNTSFHQQPLQLASYHQRQSSLQLLRTQMAVVVAAACPTTPLKQELDYPAARLRKQGCKLDYACSRTQHAK